MSDDNVIRLNPPGKAVETARLFRMIEALGAELGRQDVAEYLTVKGFDLTALARVAIASADIERPS